MNKIIIAIMALFGFCSCSSGESKKEDLEGKKVLVAYYSWGGNTKAVGNYIASKLGADVYQIETVTAYPADYDTCVKEVGRQGKKYEPELKSTTINVNDYDIVFIGSPCWWGTIANPVRTFLNGNSFEGKTVIPFMTNGSSGNRLQEVKSLCKGATVLEGLSIYNRYQIETTENTPDNMGDWKTIADEWLEKIAK